MKNLLVLLTVLLMAVPSFADYTPSQDAFQGNDVPMDTGLPFDENYEIEDEMNLQPPIPRPRRDRRFLCIVEGRRGRRDRRRGDLYYGVGRNRERAMQQARRKCRDDRRGRRYRCREYWCARVRR